MAKTAFHDIKLAIMQAPILVSPNFNQDFYIYSFASYHTITVVLTQRSESIKHRIAFMSTNLKEAKLRYSILDKKAYALLKALKKF